MCNNRLHVSLTEVLHFIVTSTLETNAVKNKLHINRDCVRELNSYNGAVGNSGGRLRKEDNTYCKRRQHNYCQISLC